MEARSLALGACVAAGISALAAGHSVVHATQSARGAHEDARLTCAPERPVVVPRERIHTTAWASDPEPPLRYQWSATAGRIAGEGADVLWDFAAVAPGTYTATVTAAGGGGSTSCSMSVVVMDPADSRGARRIPGKAFLGVKEADGYGLYSYFLLGSAPDASSRDRYASALEAYVSLMPDILSLETYSRRVELTITYVPLERRALADLESSTPPSVTPAWILEHYDYAHAAVLLSALPGRHRDGPYLVSSLTPLSGSTAVTGPHVFQDLSFVPPHLAAAWIRVFLNQTSQERFWMPEAPTLLALRLRTAIGIVAVGVPDLPRVLATWIASGPR